MNRDGLRRWKEKWWVPYPPVTTTPVAYGPQALGMALVRAMDWGTLPLLYLGRLCNLVFFVFMTWLAMKRLPFGKEVLFGTALLPMTLHPSSLFPRCDIAGMGVLFHCRVPGSGL